MGGKTAKDYAREGYTRPQLRERLKDELRASDKGGRAGQWSARKSQLLAAEYKRRGGGFRGDGNDEERERLERWQREEWQTATGETRARHGDTTERYLPRKAWEALSPEERRRTRERKRRGSRQGRQHVENPEPARRARRRASLEALTRGALYEKAQKAEIRGRSRMTKAELVDALV